MCTLLLSKDNTPKYLVIVEGVEPTHPCTLLLSKDNTPMYLIVGEGRHTYVPCSCRRTTRPCTLLLPRRTQHTHVPYCCRRTQPHLCTLFLSKVSNASFRLSMSSSESPDVANESFLVAAAIFTYMIAWRRSALLTAPPLSLSRSLEPALHDLCADSSAKPSRERGRKLARN